MAELIRLLSWLIMALMEAQWILGEISFDTVR